MALRFIQVSGTIVSEGHTACDSTACVHMCMCVCVRVLSLVSLMPAPTAQSRKEFLQSMLRVDTLKLLPVT